MASVVVLAVDYGFVVILGVDCQFIVLGVDCAFVVVPVVYSVLVVVLFVDCSSQCVDRLKAS